MQLNLEKIKGGYTFFALIVFNTFAFFIVFNVVLWGYKQFDGEPFEVATPNPRDLEIPAHIISSIKVDFDKLRPLYYYYDDTQILQLILEQYDQTFICDDDALFRNGAYPGNNFVIHPMGFRAVSPQGGLAA